MTIVFFPLVLLYLLFTQAGALVVVIAGGTGPLGKELMPMLQDHQVTVLCRNAFLAATPSRVTKDFGWVGAKFLQKNPHVKLRVSCTGERVRCIVPRIFKVTLRASDTKDQISQSHLSACNTSGLGWRRLARYCRSGLGRLAGGYFEGRRRSSAPGWGLHGTTVYGLRAPRQRILDVPIEGEAHYGQSSRRRRAAAQGLQAGAHSAVRGLSVAELCHLRMSPGRRLSSAGGLRGNFESARVISPTERALRRSDGQTRTSSRFALDSCVSLKIFPQFPHREVYQPLPS